MHFRSAFSSLVVAAGLFAASSAFAAESRDYGASGRVSALEGTVYGRGPYDTETSELAQNAVLRAGDEVTTDEGTFAEVELPNGTFLRLAGNTSIVVNKLDNDGVEIALTQGAAYLSRGANAAPARFQTFAGQVELGGRSQVRVANDQNKSALEVSVADGSAELRSDRNQQQIRARETLNTGRQNKIEGFDPARGDAFDRWNGEREAKVRGYQQDTHVAANTVGSYELEGAGTWVQIDGYPAWRPNAVATGWRPYSDGYWAWEEPWGWVWVDYQPWGYTTSHYGRWYFRNSYGWVWYADPVWAPAWVVWAAFDSSIGWAPCDFWGRPIYCHSYYSYYDYDAWCYSDSGYFYGGGGYHYAGGSGAVSARHEGVPNRGNSAHASVSRTAIGHDGRFQIKKFDAESMKRVTPVPVRDPVRDLTPAHIVKAAAEGRVPGVSAENRRGDLLDRAAKQGGVKPEPWNRGRSETETNGRNSPALGGSHSLTETPRGGNDKGGADRIKTQGWSGRGNEDGRASEGWNPRGGREAAGDNTARTTDHGLTGRQPASHFEPSGSEARGAGELDRNGEQSRGAGSWEGGRSDSAAPARGSDNTGHWAPERSGSGNDAAPARSGNSGGNTAPSAPSRGSSAPAPSHSAPAPARSAPSAPSHSTPSTSGHGKHSEWSAPSSGRSVAFGGGGHSSSFSFGHSSGGGHSSSGSAFKGFKLGKK